MDNRQSNQVFRTIIRKTADRPQLQGPGPLHTRAKRAHFAPPFRQVHPDQWEVRRKMSGGDQWQVFRYDLFHTINQLFEKLAGW